MSESSGYRGPALEAIQQAGVVVGDMVRLVVEEGTVQGILMPRYELADPNHIVVKLSSGYNVGISVNRIVRIEKLEAAEVPQFRPPLLPEINEQLPVVALLGTGGTIASRVDYRTGGVYPALSASEIYSLVPELASIARIETRVIFQIWSQDMTPKHWSALASHVVDAIRQGFDGIVIAHGTDTMGYTAAALSFALGQVSIPIVLVGAQRSSDRPSSDAASNLIAAVRFACHGPVGGVFVAMHANPSDDKIAIHQGTRVRKNHTSRRDAFQSIGVTPVAYVHGDGHIEMKRAWPWKRRGNGINEPKLNFDDRVALVKFYPGASPMLIDYLVDQGYRGIVIEGTGLGHVSHSWHPSLRRAIMNNLLVVMTSQCIWGNPRMTVYEDARQLLSIGVIPTRMISESAFVKVMWALGNSRDVEEAKELLLKPRCMEFLERDFLGGYPSHD